MEFRYSDIVNPDTYDTHGLCDGIPLRLHKNQMSEIKGAIRCQKDWSDLVSLITDYNGTLGTPFSFICVTIPETLPDRLEIISYANEYGFIYDDVIMENLDQTLNSSDRTQILKEFTQDVGIQHVQGTSYRLDGAKQIQAQIFSEMFAIDKERAKTTMKAWQSYINIVSSRQRSEPFRDLEDYLPYRISDAGELFWYGLVTFAMGLTIPEKEMELCNELARSSWEALVLTNDLYSWEKERADAIRAGDSHVINAIWILMQQHSVSEAEAKVLCRRRIKDSVTKAVRTVDVRRNDISLSLDLRRYTEAIMYSISGNLVWSIYCPRYHQREISSRTKPVELEGVKTSTHAASINRSVL